MDVKLSDGKLIDIDVKLFDVKLSAIGGGPPGCVVPSLAGQTPPGCVVPSLAGQAQPRHPRKGGGAVRPVASCPALLGRHSRGATTEESRLVGLCENR